MCYEMSTLTPKQVGDEMSIYTFRPGTPKLKKVLTSGTLYCFDKGHLRIASAPPEGFVAVPEKVILEFFGTKYTLNIRKMERAIEDYAREWALFKKGGTRPKRPTIRSLYLETPSEFELFIRPLDSFYCENLRQGFSGVLNTVEKNLSWKDRINNTLFQASAAKRQDRWSKATGVIYVHLDNFAKLDPVPNNTNPPAYIQPYPTITIASTTPTTPKATISDEEKKEAQDVDMLERTNMGRSRKYRKVLLHMSPWKASIRIANPFKSKAYSVAYMSAQHSFQLRYADFKKDIDARRSKYRADWAAYKAFKDDQKSFKPSLPYVEKPDAVEFETEWKDFIFGLKQEMKNIEFEPVRKNASKIESSIRAERIPEISTVPALKPLKAVPALKPLKAAPKLTKPIVVVEHVPRVKPPMVLPKIVMEKPKVAVVHEVLHTTDPELMIIQQDFQYSKRVLVK